MSKYDDVMNLVNEDIIEKIIKDKFGNNYLSLGFFFIDKTWADNGFDDLDLVELIMELEKELNIVITDDVAMMYFENDSKPSSIPGFKRHRRNEKLKIILNEK